MADEIEDGRRLVATHGHQCHRIGVVPDTIGLPDDLTGKRPPGIDARELGL